MDDEIITFFTILEKEVQKLEYGTITGTVLVAGGKPVSPSLNFTLSKRRRYKTSKVDNNTD